ncbi:hypothetical protein [Lactimicrobium massiliense]|uniref:hypothetical protein n=1 Tax=Lactimicrobium massiliense TaxID=2161814 RepID=UPI000D5591C2|nr:hypothetical protein [Lactimicrobium massiliense]
MINSKVGRKETTSDDIDAYDLIMKNKELLLDCESKNLEFNVQNGSYEIRIPWVLRLTGGY